MFDQGVEEHHELGAGKAEGGGGAASPADWARSCTLPWSRRCGEDAKRYALTGTTAFSSMRPLARGKSQRASMIIQTSRISVTRAMPTSSQLP